jgi:hypothetical protein
MCTLKITFYVVGHPVGIPMSDILAPPLVKNTLFRERRVYPKKNTSGGPGFGLHVLAVRGSLLLNEPNKTSSGTSTTTEPNVHSDLTDRPQQIHLLHHLLLSLPTGQPNPTDPPPSPSSRRHRPRARPPPLQPPPPPPPCRPQTLARIAPPAPADLDLTRRRPPHVALPQVLLPQAPGRAPRDHRARLRFVAITLPPNNSARDSHYISLPFHFPFGRGRVSDRKAPMPRQ